jgi:imidazolonepropionase-like amidohydrolase
MWLCVCKLPNGKTETTGWRHPHDPQVVTFLAWYSHGSSRPTNREQLIQAMCHMQRASGGASECEFCNGGECSSQEAAACADLALALGANLGDASNAR